MVFARVRAVSRASTEIMAWPAHSQCSQLILDAPAATAKPGAKQRGSFISRTQALPPSASRKEAVDAPFSVIVAALYTFCREAPSPSKAMRWS